MDLSSDEMEALWQISKGSKATSDHLQATILRLIRAQCIELAGQQLVLTPKARGILDRAVADMRRTIDDQEGINSTTVGLDDK